MGVVFAGNHGGGGNNVTTVTADCNTMVPSQGAPVAGDIQILSVYCGSLAAGTDWTTKPTNTGWTQIMDLVLGGGTNWQRHGIWSRVYGGAGGTGNPTITGPLDQTTSGYNYEVCTAKTTSNRANTNVTLDNSSFMDASVGNAAYPSLFAAQKQASYLAVCPAGINQYPFKGPLLGIITGNMMVVWEAQNAPSNLITPPSSPVLPGPGRYAFVFTFSDGGVNNGYSAFLAGEEMGQILEGVQPVVMPPRVFLAPEETLVLNNPVIAGGGGDVSSNFGSGVGIIIAT